MSRCTFDAEFFDDFASHSDLDFVNRHLRIERASGIVYLELDQFGRRPLKMEACILDARSFFPNSPLPPAAIPDVTKSSACSLRVGSSLTASRLLALKFCRFPAHLATSHIHVPPKCGESRCRWGPVTKYEIDLHGIDSAGETECD
eukprot:6180494-Pleurochrysis_carterae.AAC.1